jgi:hypothetical protein
MTVKLTEYHTAILRYIDQNIYGKRRTDKLYSEFESDMLDRDDIDNLIEDLQDAGYVKAIEIDEQKIQFLDLADSKSMSNSGYKITQLGKSRIGSYSPTTIYSNINNSNIAHQSPNSIQTVKISEQPEDIQQKFAELKDAIDKKDSSVIKKAFGYIADKSVDVAIAILAGAVIS